MATRPNIIQIVVDDMGSGDLSSVNGGLSSTPVLDQLAADGVSLSQHYSGSPVCAPARAALLTGRYPHRTGVIDTMEARGLDRLAVGERTQADELSELGYATGLVGKWHNGAFDPAFHPTHRGFTEFVGFQGGWQDYWDWRIEKGGARMSGDGRHLTDVFTAEALDFVRRNAGEPFYLHLAYNAPHFPLQAPAELVERFHRNEVVSRAVATIYAMLAMVDDGVGALLQLLDDLGIADNTIVMFTSDNGPDFHGEGEESTHRFNSGLRGSKTVVFEGGIKVPMMVRWPDGLPGRSTHDGLVHFVDWMPTLIDAAGGRRTIPRLDGASRLAALRGERDEPSTRFWQWTRYTPLAESNSAMRDGDWKLVWPAWERTLDALQSDLDRDAEIKVTEPQDIDVGPIPLFSAPATSTPLLFNLRSDPHETIDLADAQPGRVRSMSNALHAWFNDVEGTRLDRLQASSAP
ncbi:sulfatase-like hydrolase/transferase [Salinibacterium sp. G-O1]|uniref:sulfatase-like hydrolase/transferase n=1 Tax=Salinibacterium sp. G-O1 TaxID=3046208 RepID=UPI0024BACE2F|nr:sulfatase-like hydrolase/transferase [Salinibacterium sp. G-O1]MDJ0334062.1 sulfatase-like hydrolase/transferase [Salinibacterium sp. G-O1]